MPPISQDCLTARITVDSHYLGELPYMEFEENASVRFCGLVETETSLIMILLSNTIC